MDYFQTIVIPAMDVLTILSYFILVIYTLVLLYICIYCLLQFQLLYHYRKTFGEQHSASQLKHYPIVTIQLPIYNEKYVIERLLDAVCRISYPKDKLHIQVLDDSTDETVDIAKQKVLHYQQQGFDIHYLHRSDRKGFKAGALQHAMKTVKGEYIGIFDADFVPKKHFLLETIPYFDDPSVGVVQTRWEHINQDYSLITKVQALQLNVHFTVEQKGRDNGSYFLQFNGTAGLWRRSTIVDAGGWQADTLTEDLDLSYRAQLKGWKIKFLEHLGSPSELPVEMNSFKSQQFRWMKGGAETAKKLLPTIWKSNLSFSQKIHASIHLLGSTVFVFVFILGIISVPALFAIHHLMINASYWSIFFISSIALIFIYYVANVQNPFTAIEKDKKQKNLIKFFFLFPLFLALSMGLSLHNSIAVIQGYLGKKSPFVRTPKFNIQDLNDSISPSRKYYLNIKWDWKILLEGLMACYFLVGLYHAITWGNYSMFLFHILLFLGYSSIFYFSLRDLRIK